MKRLILLFVSLMLLTSCFAGRKVDENKGQEARPFGEREADGSFNWDSFFANENADFYISRVDARPRLNNDSIDSDTGLHSYVEYTFTMQIRSRANEQTLDGFDFIIKGKNNEEIYERTTNRKGELSWTEKIEFDQQRPQLDPLLVVKDVIGQGAAKGTAYAIYEINPWALTESGLGEAFRDLTNDLPQLKQRHTHYNPDFDYISYLINPYEDKAPVLNVKRANFYISKEEKILDTFSTLQKESYRKAVSPVDKDISFYNRGNLYASEEPIYVLREEIASEDDISPVGMNLTLEANISLERKYWVGDQERYTDIKQGQFVVYAALMGSNQGTGSPIILAVSKADEVKELSLENKTLGVKFNMYTPYLVNRGDVEVALKVIPMGAYAKKGLKPFGRIYKVGNYTDLDGFSGDFQSAINFEDGFEFDSYMKSAVHFTKEHEGLLLEKGLLRESQDTIFSAMQIKFRTVKAGETASQRTVIFSVTTCPYDGFTGRSLDKGRKFKVLVSGLDPLSNKTFSRVPLSEIRQDGGDSMVEIRDDSCLSWTDEIAHKYYQRENLIDREYTLVEGSKEYTLKGYFNPWDEKYGTLGVDSRTLSDSFLEELQTRVKLPSRFFAGDFSYMTIRFRYDVDKDMKLTVKKTVLMTMYPFVKRYSNIINGINGNFPIRDGVYLLKIAYQKDYIDPGAPGIELRPDRENQSRVKINVIEGGNRGADRLKEPFVEDDVRRRTMIHTIKKLIRVENNRVITPIEFEIDDLRTLRVRSNLLVELEPVNQYKLQIINLFEKQIAKKLTVEIGSLNKLHCLPKDYKDKVFEVFQKTLDDIARAIPDDVNYNSLAAFHNVINSEGVKQALNNLTESGLLPGLTNAFSLDIEGDTLERAFQNLTLKEIEEIDGVESLEEALALEERARKDEAERRIREVQDQNKTIFGVLEQLADKAASSNEGEAPFVPIGGEGEKGDSLNPLGTDEDALAETVDELKGYVAEEQKDSATEDFLSEISDEKNLQTLINNDFTIDPAVARVSDLDYLIDRKAGIIRRTFVGPLTLIALDNKNTMQATDALDKCSNDDCSEQSIAETYNDYLDGDYSKNPNFGYQGHFKNCHVDDFIVREDQEAFVYDAWTECVSRDLTQNENLIKIPEGYVCDYKSTQAYQENPDVFTKYIRHGTELEAYKGGTCPYREVWLKKYFSQKRSDLAKKQFGNYLSNPGVRARVIVSPDNKRNLEVTHISEDCLQNSFVNKDCLVPTDKFDWSVKDMAEALSEYGISQMPRKSFFNRRDLGLAEEGQYKESLEAFYKAFQDKDSNSFDQGELSNLIYKTLVEIAAPEQNIQEYEGRLDQAAPADFGEDLQKFLCNILLPQVFKTNANFMAKYANRGASPGPAGDSVQLMNALLSMKSKCFVHAESKSIEIPLPFVIERKFRVLETGRYFFRGGKSINFTIGGNIGLSHSRSWSNGYKFDPYNGGFTLAAAGVGFAIGGPIGAGAAAVVVGSANGLLKLVKLTDYSRSESNGMSDGTSLGTSTHLSMQAAQLDLELTKYRRCMLVKWNPDFIDRVVTRNQKTIDVGTQSNFFICSDEESKPLAVRENYYYVTQHFTEGDLLDSGSLLNNPWLLNLRGYRDMVTFVRSLYPENENFEPSVLGIMEDDLNRIGSEREVFTEGQARLSERRVTNDDVEAWRTMSKAYRAQTPAFPGLFTQLNKRELSMPDWPWNQEVQINEPEGRSCD